MGKKLTKKLLVFLTLMCMIIGMNVSVSAETGSTGNTKAISAAENPADGTLQVWLEYEDDNGNSVALSGGSCFLINEEYVLSNYHIFNLNEEIAPGVTIRSAAMETLGLSELKDNDPHLKIRVYANRDMSVLATIHDSVQSQTMDYVAMKLSDKIYDRKPLALGDSSTVQQTQTVNAYGFPEDSIENKEFNTAADVSATDGTISKLTVGGRADFFEHTAQLNHGNSGGPLVDSNKSVIGVNTFTYGNSSDQKYYAVQINAIKSGLDTFGISYINAGAQATTQTPDEEEPEEKEEYINIIENNNTLLLQLVGDILDLSKIESGTLEFVYSDIDLNALFQELEESARLRQKNDAVVIRYLPEMPDCFVNIEKNRLTQVVTNMMNNAMKFTPSGSITFGYHLKNTDFLYFYITDTGYGIEKDKKDTVFGRFVKLDSFSQGTGLGLSICQSIVENLGGEIGVESEPGKGSTFWFTLPYRPVELKSVREQKEHRLNKVESKLTVLIAEDNESNFLLFESILKRQYNILHAWDGEEAVELFKQYNPHLILMDINMPKKTGYEATQLIREMSPTVPIMAVTAYVYAEDEERILNSGFDAYTSKPINAQKLQSDIVDLLKKQLIFM